MHIKKISVKKLFGVFDHEVPLNEGGITIVIGENGLGKTVLLEATSAFFAENFLFFRDLEFQQLSFQFEDQSWVVSKSQTADRLAIYVNRHLATMNPKTRTERPEKPVKIVDIEIREKPSKRSKFEYLLELQMLERLGPVATASEQRILEYTQAAMQNLLFDEDLFHRGSKPREIPSWYKEGRKRISIRLIETQRIITAKERGGESYVNRVTKSAKELAELIAEIDKVASQTTTELDGTFPNRLVRKLRQAEPDSFEDLNTALLELDDRRKKLSSLGLLEVSVDTDILQVVEGQPDLSSAGNCQER